MVKDMTQPIQELKDALKELQGKMGKIPDEDLGGYNVRVAAAFQDYDEKLVPLKRAMSINKPKQTKAKAMNAAKPPKQ